MLTLNKFEKMSKKRGKIYIFIERGTSVKVLDVQPFQEGLQRNIETLEGIAQLMQAIEKVMTELVSMNDTWKGEGGDAIRAFYEECHLPFLKFFSIFNNNFVSSIQQIMKAQTSLEPYNSGYINEGFIEEVKVGLQRVERITANLTDESNGIMDSVSDIVSLPHLDDTEVQEGIRRARRKSDDTIAGLQEFDLSQSALLTIVANDLRVMERWIDDVESSDE